MAKMSPESEAKRLQALQETGLLDSVPEEEFDDLVKLAAYICGAPISLISLVDEDRQWFKARVGLAVSETPRDVSFCAHVIEQDQLFVVPDALEDPRFVKNGLVQGDPHVRFYAGYPLSTDTGENLGALCVIDRVPRQLTEQQENALRVLARQVMTHIQLKRDVALLCAAAREKDELTRKLAASDASFRCFLEASPAAAFIKDAEGRMVFCNSALSSWYAAKPEDWIGKTDFEIWPPEFTDRYRKRDLEILGGSGPQHFDDDCPAPDGTPRNWSVYKFPFTNAEGERFVAGVAIDVTREREVEQELLRYQQELRDLNMKLHRLSLTDGLTRVKNRRGLEDSLEREFYRAQRSDSPLSMLLLDVDHFKQFNDAHGHIAGDHALQRIAALMKEHTRKSDVLARYGGEEFVALLPDTCEAEAVIMANRLRHFIAEDNWDHRKITVSLGVGTLPPHISDPNEFIRLVDQALYQAKHQGRNQVCVADCRKFAESCLSLCTPVPLSAKISKAK